MFWRILLFFKHIVLGIIRSSRKLLCFRRKKVGLDEDEAPTSIVVVGPTLNLTSETLDSENQQWESWDNQGFETENQMAQQQPNHNIAEEDPPQENFFKDMEPKVRVKKIYVQKNRTEAPSNRLSMKQDLDFETTGELETWDEDGGGWEDENIDEKQALREMGERKRIERLMRQEQQRNNKIRNERLATKVS